MNKNSYLNFAAFFFANTQAEYWLHVDHHQRKWIQKNLLMRQLLTIKLN